MVVQKILTFLPKFEIHKNGQYMGCLNKEFSFFVPHYNLDYNGWHIDGSIMEWDYQVLDRSGNNIASVSKELFNLKLHNTIGQYDSKSGNFIVNKNKCEVYEKYCNFGKYDDDWDSKHDCDEIVNDIESIIIRPGTGYHIPDSSIYNIIGI